MLKYYNYDILFQEVPDEVTLAVNITGCPNCCPGCHSTHLRKDIGAPLTEEVLGSLIKRYGASITCLCFMGGDSDPEEVERLAGFSRSLQKGLKIAWYSGKNSLPEHFLLKNFNYIKLGEYLEALGGLKSKRTNQRFYAIGDNCIMKEITGKFSGTDFSI
ncbi:hypothetical protein SDC9_180982 [bioreactor metagenome]|uniref:Uncharacterized protein n=1 Tax=bioreactor metagenome TaxID=1076179 RepID=A0A645HBM9_9ZZZZ|nr:anaerobic ribonucleoside-triphosphate reductase activating protein [Rikenellaceae bacterium]